MWDSNRMDGAGSHPPFKVAVWKLRSAESGAPSDVFLGAVSAGSRLIWILKLAHLDLETDPATHLRAVRALVFPFFWLQKWMTLLS